MTKNIRDFLSIIFITLFVVLTIFISLFASGYKLDLQLPIRFNKLLIKTGMLVIDTTPGGAVIFLDGKIQKSSTLSWNRRAYLITPVKIKNILPGKHSLRLDKKGYWPIEKHIIVQPGQTVFIENINLFKIDQALRIYPHYFKNLELSPNNRYLLSVKEHQLLDLKSEQIIKLDYKASSNFQWLNKGNKLLINGIIFDLENNLKLNYQKIIGTDESNWFWDESNNSLYYQTKTSINRFQTSNSTNTIVNTDGNYLDYSLHGSQLFYLVSNKQIILKDYSLDKKIVIKEVILPTNGSYKFEKNQQKWLSLYDQKNNTLYIFNPQKIDESEKIIRDIKNWEWLNSEQLIYHNDFEIYLLNLRQNTTTLITRVGEKIKKILYNRSEHYLVFATNTSLNVIDLKSNNITTILKAQEISSPVLDRKDDTLYFNAKINKKEGVYKIIIR